MKPACASIPKPAFEFHLVKRPQIQSRIRLPGDQTVSSLSPLELLGQYWLSSHTDPEEAAQMSRLAEQIISGDGQGTAGP